jgi:hypothetical protein
MEVASHRAALISSRRKGAPLASRSVVVAADPSGKLVAFAVSP